MPPPERVGKLRLRHVQMRPASLGSHLRGCSPLQRTQWPSIAAISHVCGLRSIFTDVHAAGENNKRFIRRCGELCEALSEYVCASGASVARPAAIILA
jgi:hypothetical protein